MMVVPYAYLFFQHHLGHRSPGRIIHHFSKLTSICSYKLAKLVRHQLCGFGVPTGMLEELILGVLSALVVKFHHHPWDTISNQWNGPVLQWEREVDEDRNKVNVGLLVFSHIEKWRWNVMCIHRFLVDLTEQLMSFARMVWNSENLPAKNGFLLGSIGSVTPTNSCAHMSHKWNERQGQYTGQSRQ